MKTWVIRVEATISDEMEVEAETEQEAIDAAHEDWRFTEADNWTEEVLSWIEHDEEES
jgi:hypothetical protein